MKLKFNRNLLIYFINNIMSLNIDEEHNKLIQIIDDNTFDWLKFTRKNCVHYNNVRINFLWRVLMLTVKYPQVESYLKNILNYFTIDELENIHGYLSVLHYMLNNLLNISLNAFEIIINYGVNVNVTSIHGGTLIHKLLYDACDNHNNNILNLFIKYGINLNTINLDRLSVLDVLSYYRFELDEETKKCIMTIIDFGGTTNKPNKNNAIYDFIEYYKCTIIKPAIKNETKI